MKKSRSVLAISAVMLCAVSAQLFAANTAASGMHYGKPVVSQSIVKAKDGAPIVVTNCSYDDLDLSAWFASDGSSGNWGMGPTGSGTDIITLGDGPGAGTAPYVNIKVTDNGVILYNQTTYPGANVNIGCDQALQIAKHPIVTVTTK